MSVQDYEENQFKASVGFYGASKRNCYNTIDDQTMVRDLLNAIPESQGGAGGKLSGPLKWGVAREDLFRAIVRFQQAHSEEHLSVDGHVDPHQKTLRLLLKLAKATRPPQNDAPIGPAIHPPLDLPPNPGIDPRIDPNVVFAGNQFKIKTMDALSFGEVVGLTTLSFVIWDVDNNRAAGYEFIGLTTTFGTPISSSSEGDWSAPFSTAHSIQVDQFGGDASVADGGVGPIGFISLSFIGNPFIGSVVKKVNVPSGFTKGLGIEASKGGSLKLIRGSVSVFSGP